MQVVRQPCAILWTIRSKSSTTLSLVAKLFVTLCDHWCKVARDQHLGFTFTRLLVSLQVRKQMPVANDLVHFWFTLGALLVHFWCTPGALPVHLRCTPGAMVHSKGFPKGKCFTSERKSRSSVQKRLDRLSTKLQTRKGIAPLPKGSLNPSHRNVLDPLFATLQTRKGIAPLPKGSLDPPDRNVLARPSANLQTRKGIAPLPKGSLDPPHRNVWIVFPPSCKPEREIAPLPKGSLDPPHRNVWIAQDITTFITGGGVTTTRPQQNTLETLPTERSMNGPGAHPAQRVAGTCRCASTASYILRTTPVAPEATAQPGQPLRVRQLGEEKESRKVWTMGNTSAPRRGSHRP